MSGSEIDDYCELGKNGGAMKSFHPSQKNKKPERVSCFFRVKESNREGRSRAPPVAGSVTLHPMPQRNGVCWRERKAPRE